MDSFLSNSSNERFLEHVKCALTKCTSFSFSVSFIKLSGLSLLIDDIVSALRRGAVGRVLTSTYQNFTDIPSLQKLYQLSQEFSSFQSKLEYNDLREGGFHTKGYLFEYEDKVEVIIGSSNITRYALIKNIEWNVSVVSKQDQLFQSVLREFDEIWNQTKDLSLSLIQQYEFSRQYAIISWDMDFSFASGKVTPNEMQKKALFELQRYRDLGVSRALVISATGSGKTYLAAFDCKNMDITKLLYVVHRETILSDAIHTYENVFGTTRSYGLFTGNYQETDVDFLFASNIMISKHFQMFDKNQFDYIIIDEVHHSTAESYQSLFSYFTPKFLLGLTATPERYDQQDIFKLFENNVPYELRLRDALNLDLVVPFKYFGIKDELLEYDKATKNYILRSGSQIENAQYIEEKLEEYRPKGKKLSAIAFCSSKRHANEMREIFDQFGYFTKVLTGDNNTAERLLAFQNLQNPDHSLEIIFTVDILNEGVDIPGINLVMFLRPTESSTIFIQQLGRGLRKYPGKDFLTVLDFIGNSYTRGVQIALAVGSLSNDVIVDRVTLKEYIRNDFDGVLPRGVEIHLDELSKEEILSSIESTNFNSFEFLKQDYLNIKKYLNKTEPLKHIDLLDTRIVSNSMRFVKKQKCLYNFLRTVETDQVPFFSESEVAYIESLTNMLPLVRPIEYSILQYTMEKPYSLDEIFAYVSYLYPDMKYPSFSNAVSFLLNELYSNNKKASSVKLWGESERGFQMLLPSNNENFVDHLKDLLEFGLQDHQQNYGNYDGNFKLFHSYRRDQFLLMINQMQYTFQQGIFHYNSEVYFFIDLIKKSGIEEHLKYNDRFIDSNTILWESQTETTLTNNKGKKLLSYRQAHIFVRKSATIDGLLQPYIYLGKGHFHDPHATNNPKLTISVKIELETELPKYLQTELMDLEAKYEEDH